MKTLALSKGQKALVDSEDHAVASQYRWNYQRAEQECASLAQGRYGLFGTIGTQYPDGRSSNRSLQEREQAR